MRLASVAMKNEHSHASAHFVRSAHEAYGAELHRFLVRRLGKSQDAEDLAQEVYLRLLRLEKAALVRKPIAYMYVVATQVVAQFRMQMEHDPTIYDSETVSRWAEHLHEEPTDALAARLSDQQQLKQLLAELPAMHRNVLLLRKRDGLSWVEIAQKLGISEHTVKKYLYEARARLTVLRLEG
jgi:RNA polymerase sigma-19 factor, ECF subfamily